jgi:hypothetical protein
MAHLQNGKKSNFIKKHLRYLNVRQPAAGTSNVPAFLPLLINLVTSEIFRPLINIW